MIKKTDYFYKLPQELIAQTPIEPRDSSRLLCYDRKENKIYDKHFFDIADLLRQGDLLVVNNTRVIPARLFGTKVNKDVVGGKGAKIEVFLLKRNNLTDFTVLIRPGKRVKDGAQIFFSNELSCEVLGGGEDGQRNVRFVYSGVFEEILDRLGETPLPHYIHEKLENKQRYQTVYAKFDGSSAAPTAGLHFTDSLLEKIRAKGVELCEVLLHVGIGTFRPVSVDNILEHKMHSEYYEISSEAAQQINKAREQGRRIIAVGTTSVRVLESAAKRFEQQGRIEQCSGETNIFIYPPYSFGLVSGLITNFHLPESTLIMLVSAFMGRENTLCAYQYAVKNNYRFFSFGDAMFII